jgi:hypothetical protein
MFKTYTGWQYLLIDAAGHYGLEKGYSFEDRIRWATDNLEILEKLVAGADKPSLYRKSVMAIRKAQEGKAIGHMVHMDASASGIQIMSALTGCKNGAFATGLVDPDRPQDAYGLVTETLNKKLGSNIQIPRCDAKQAVMTQFYGSKAVPEALFGEGTPELAAFYEACNDVAPGANQLLKDLLGSWQSTAEAHTWVIADGFESVVKVMVKKESRIEVDELDHATFTYEYYENEPTFYGLSIAANVVHSVDAMILREMHRRCNYDAQRVKYFNEAITLELLERMYNPYKTVPTLTPKVEKYMNMYYQSEFASAVVVPYLSDNNIKALPTTYLKEINKVLGDMLLHAPFQLVTIHDSYASSPNNVNHVRYHYKEILAELSESTVIDDLLSQINNVQGTFAKLSTDLSGYIRNSNYGLT